MAIKLEMESKITAKELSGHLLKTLKPLVLFGTAIADRTDDKFMHGFRSGEWSTLLTVIGLLELFEATGGLPNLVPCDPSSLFGTDAKDTMIAVKSIVQ